MRYFITGGSGFVGRNLITVLIKQGHEITTIGSSPDRPSFLDPAVTYIAADTTRPGPWQDELKSSDVIVNLAGRSIFKRWSESYKRQIYDSRILTTRNLVEALPEQSGKTLISTSAAGYYGDAGDQELTEDQPPGNDFLATVCRDWEAEALKAEEKGARVIITRFGVVLGDSGGAIGIMLLPFRFFVGGRLGSGRQWFSWVHIEDLIAGMLHQVEGQAKGGIYNLTAPQPIRNEDMARIIGRVLHRPAWFPTPAFAIRLALGEFGSMVLFSQRVVPRRLTSEGYTFRFAEFEAALRSVLGK